MSDQKSLIAVTLRRWRKSAGLSQEKASSITGMARQTISYWENDKRIFNPRIDILMRVVDAFGIDVKDVVEVLNANRER